MSDTSEDVTVQVISKAKASSMFSFQVDEATDVSSCGQLVFVKYINFGDFKEEFLFCSDLDTTRKIRDIVKR